MFWYGYYLCGMMLSNVMVCMLVSPRGPMYFRCLMFNLSEHVEVFFALLYCLLYLSCCECNVI